MADIINFPEKGAIGDIPVSEVLKGCEKLQMVTIMGYDQDGNEFFASSSGDAQEVYWLLGRFRKFLEDIAEDE